MRSWDETNHGAALGCSAGRSRFMAIHKVAVISDTHGILRQEVIEVLKTTERILHGGDITSKKVPDKLSEIAGL